MADRAEAAEYLRRNVFAWPKSVPNHVGPSAFFGWRFVETLDGEIVFGNCLSPGITEKEFSCLPVSIDA